MHKENMNTANGNIFIRAGKTLWRWAKRMFMGASKELTDDERFAVEKIESPSGIFLRKFSAGSWQWWRWWFW